MIDSGQESTGENSCAQQEKFKYSKYLYRGKDRFFI